MRDKYFIPWQDESTEHTQLALDYLAFEISAHSNKGFKETKEGLHRYLGWCYSTSKHRGEK